MDIWREGKYLDLWSLVHFLSGVVLAGWLTYFGMDVFLALALYIVVAILWEVFEHYRGIEEHMKNRVVDVVVGVLGWICVFVARDQGNLVNFGWLAFFTLIFTLLNLHGYITYKHRTPKEEKLAHEPK